MQIRCSTCLCLTCARERCRERECAECTGWVDDGTNWDCFQEREDEDLEGFSLN